MGMFGRRRNSTTASPDSAPTIVPELSKAQVKRATRTRKTWALLTSFLLFVTVVFLVLVEIGGIKNKKVLRDWYFIRIDVSNIIPASVPNFALINTIAQTLGLHDFYQVGLWGFCEGYVNEGVTYCSPPKTLYWFNPVEILGNELLSGASSTYLLPVTLCRQWKRTNIRSQSTSHPISTTSSTSSRLLLKSCSASSSPPPAYPSSSYS
jgi:hypothetical protein